jgi:hypothetical protein
MRTKTLLLTAALGAASIATSMAQAVYSVNIVGYINLTMKPGFNLIANQLNNGSPANRITTLFTDPPEESQVLEFAGGNYHSDIYIRDLGGWVDAIEGTASTTAVDPGEGIFFFNAALSDHPVTLVGEVILGATTVTLNPGFTLFSSKVPMNIDVTPANGLIAGEEDQFLTFNALTQNYNTGLINLADLGGWVDQVSGTPTAPSLVVGQGAFYFNASVGTPRAWSRTFTP